MAKNSGSSLITLGGLAVAAYFAYEYFFKSTATTAASTSSTTSGTFSPSGGGTSAAPKIGDEILSNGSVVAVYNGSAWHVPPLTAAETAAITAQQNAVANTTTGTATSTATTATTTTAASTATTASTLDTVYAAMKADVVANADPNFTGTGDAMSSTPYRWNFYLQRVYTGTIPDLSTLFSDTSANVSAEQFWAAMGPALKSANSGLSGLWWLGDATKTMAGAGW